MNTSTLLTDTQLQNFIYNGYLTITSSLPANTHKEIHQALEDWFSINENPGNDILARVPELTSIFEDPAVTGALTSILGPRYLIHRHRHCHNHGAGAQAQTIHKDYPIGGNVRNHHPRTVLILYYPHTVTQDMGPTAVQPRSQYYITPEDGLEEIPICCEGGTVVITHYEIWHRAMHNRSPETRYMVKFLGTRTLEPTVPSWENTSCEWHHSSGTSIGHSDVCRHIWNWYLGDFAEPVPVSHPDGDVMALVSDDLKNERSRIHASYRASNCGEQILPGLLEAMTTEAGLKKESNAERADFTNPSQLDLTFALAAMGNSSVDVLSDTLAHSDWWVRAAAAAALGAMGSDAYPAAEALGKALKDENEWVRRNASEALGNIGVKAEKVVPGLLEALGDRRPVSRWSLSGDGFRENVMMALLKIIPNGKRDLFPEFKKLEDDPSEYVRSSAKHMADGVDLVF